MADTVELSGAGGLASLTRKSRDMAYARNPQNNNEMNLDSMERKAGVVPQPALSETKEQVEGVKAKARQQTVETQMAPQVAQLQGKLGSFATALQAEVNRFLDGETVATANASLSGGAAPVWDAKTGQWVAPAAGAQVNASLSDVLSEKQAQQAALKAQAGDLFDERGRAKSFEDVLARFADQDGDGQISQEEQQFLNESFGIVNALRRLQTLSKTSPEYGALQMQLMAKDKDGLVSGLMDAMEKYDETAGLKVSGAEAEEYELQDLLTMGSEELLSQLDKAVKGSTGLFGGDFQAALRREVDNSQRQYSAAAREDAQVLNAAADEAEAWLEEYESQFEARRGELNSLFLQSAKDVVSNLEALKAQEAEAGRDTKWVDEAQRWFVDLQNGVATGSRDFAQVLQDMMASEGGMAPEARALLKRWVGQTLGEETVAKGEIARALQKIAETGYLHVTDEAGNVVRRPLTADQQMRLAHVLDDRTLSGGQKAAAIQGIIEEASGSMGQDLKQDAKYVADLIKDGQLATALDSFETALTASLTSFRDSVARDFYGKVVAAGVDPATMGPDAMQGAMQQRADTQMKSITSAYQAAQKQAQGMLDTAQRDWEETNTLLKDLDGIQQAGYENTRKNIDAALASAAESYKGRIAATLATYPDVEPGDVDRKAKAYAFLQLMKRSRGTSPIYAETAKLFPNLDQYLANPRFILGMTPEDMQKIAVVEQMAAAIPYDKIFEGTLPALALKDKAVRLIQAQRAAYDGGVKAQRLLTQMGAVYAQAGQEVASVAKLTPRELFELAKQGQAGHLAATAGIDGYVPQFGKLQGEADFIEDASNLDAVESAGSGITGANAEGGEVGLKSWEYHEAPKKQREEKEKPEPTKKREPSPTPPSLPRSGGLAKAV